MACIVEYSNRFKRSTPTEVGKSPSTKCRVSFPNIIKHDVKTVDNKVKTQSRSQSRTKTANIVNQCVKT